MPKAAPFFAMLNQWGLGLIVIAYLRLMRHQQHPPKALGI
jgi:replicative DNA helicase